MKNMAPTMQEIKDVFVLKRNMDVLKKNYPDLESIIF